MTGSTISGTVAHPVRLGSHTYGSPLTVAVGGEIAPGTSRGIGVHVAKAVKDANLTNDGTIVAGYGGTGIVSLAFLTLVNAGTILGGTGIEGDPDQGAGIDLRVGGRVTNSGLIEGNGDGISMAGGTVSNTGTILGGPPVTNAFYISEGGIGVDLSASGTLTNSGLIRGGYITSSPGQQNYGSSALPGVELRGGTLTNSGTIMGGGTVSANGHGDAALVLSAGASADNTGAILGLTGGYGPDEGYAGSTGVNLLGGTLITSGTITGGQGGPGDIYSGEGGVGVVIVDGTLMASGTITGGDVGLGGQPTFGGGAGVTMQGGTLIAAGTIAGGHGNSMVTAVEVTSGTLIVDPGAVFDGVVKGNADAKDQLVLGGTTSGTLSGLGSEFIDFPKVSVAAAASWTLRGVNTTQATLAVGGNLVVSGTLDDSGRAFIENGATLAVAGMGTLTVGSLNLTGGMLEGAATGAIAIGPTAGGAGAITLDEDIGVHGFGTIAGAPVVDDGSIVAQSGTLTLVDAVSGEGKLVVGADATLAAHGALGGTFVQFGGPGTLVLGDPTAVTAQMQEFAAGDVIDLQGLAANTFSFSGGTLTLDNGSTPLASLVFQGTYTSSNFMLDADHESGTDVSFVTSASEVAAVADTTMPSVGHIGQWDRPDTSLIMNLVSNLAHHGLN
jgi:hypothetical protein